MARDILCMKCAREMILAQEKEGERYRAIVAPLIVDCKCDGCYPAKELAKGETAMAFTTHPQGPEIVMAWEHEFLQMGGDDGKP